MISIVIICISALVTCFLTVEDAIEKSSKRKISKSKKWKTSIIVVSALITLYLGISESISKEKSQAKQKEYQERLSNTQDSLQLKTEKIRSLQLQSLEETREKNIKIISLEDKLASKSDSLLASERKNSDNLTGGQSYPVINISPNPYICYLLFKSVGINPLYDVNISFQDPMRLQAFKDAVITSRTKSMVFQQNNFDSTIVDIPAFNASPSSTKQIYKFVYPESFSVLQFHFTITCRNGYFAEDLKIENQKNHLYKKVSYKIFKNGILLESK
jgi:hypothetical protein